MLLFVELHGLLLRAHLRDDDGVQWVEVVTFEVQDRGEFLAETGLEPTADNVRAWLASSAGERAALEAARSADAVEVKFELDHYLESKIR